LNEKPRKPKPTIKTKAHTRVRTHKLETISKNNLAQYLDKLHSANGTVMPGGLNISLDIGGSYEVVSYTETEE
jgi:hypothetical protein